MRTSHAVLAMATAVALLTSTDAAEAQVPGLSLTFLQPTGTVAPNASIDVWMRFATAGSFAFDARSPAQGFGLPPAAVPTIGSWNGVQAPIASFTSAFLEVGADCGGTFTGGCGLSLPYTFAFATSQSIINLTTLVMPAGSFFDFIIGTFTPNASGASPGRYSFDYTDVHIDFNALDANGNPLVAGMLLANTCSPVTPGCGFERTVIAATTATPEPASVTLFATGLAALSVLVRRRRPSA